MANYIEMREENDQNIVFYTNIRAEVFRVYYKGKNKILPMPMPYNFKTNIDTKKYQIHNYNEIEFFLNKNKISNDTIWLITERTDNKLWGELNIYIINNYLRENQRVLLDTIFENTYLLKKVVIKNVHNEKLK